MHAPTNRNPRSVITMHHRTGTWKRDRQITSVEFRVMKHAAPLPSPTLLTNRITVLTSRTGNEARCSEYFAITEGVNRTGCNHSSFCYGFVGFTLKL
jgi:hypothetical protein